MAITAIFGLVGLIEPEPAQQLVGQRRLAGPAGAGDAQHGHVPACRSLGDRRQQLVAGCPGLERGDGARQVAVRSRQQVLDVDERGVEGHVALGDHRVDHHRQTQALAVLRREHPGDATPVQLVDLVLHDHAATAAVDANVADALVAQPVEEVREVLHVAALVRADRQALHVLVQRGAHDLVDRSVVARGGSPRHPATAGCAA